MCMRGKDLQLGFRTDPLLAVNAMGRQQQKGNEHAAKNHYASLP